MENLTPRTIFSLRRRQTANYLGILLLLLTACNNQTIKTATPQPTPEVIVTSYPSFMIGELVNEDGCIRVRNQISQVTYTIVWTPDVSGTIEGDQVKVVMGIVRKSVSKIALNFGDVVYVGGGESAFPDEKLLQLLPSSCQKPYWIVGSIIEKYQPTKKP